MSGNLPETPWQGERNQQTDSSGRHPAAAPVKSARPRSWEESARQTAPASHPKPLRAKPTAEQLPATSPRFLVEALVLLALAVTVFRTFVVEGFMISTSSMAPTLWGYHYRYECPDCGFLFAQDAAVSTEFSSSDIFRQQVSPEESHSAATSLATGSELSGSPVRCPHCGYAHIPRQPVIHEGDQLLVDKQAFFWNPPRRWDTVIFRNPQRPVQAFAKRIVGLPGEIISLRDGDLYVRDAIQRKTLNEQRQVRILISDTKFTPTLHDANWSPHWQASNEQAAEIWDWTPHGFLFEPEGPVSRETNHWLDFALWKRQGGHQKTTVPLERWPTDLPLPGSDLQVKYDSVQKLLYCHGALTAETATKLQGLSGDPEFRKAIQLLFEESHQQPLTDTLTYNPQPDQAPKAVHELMLELELQTESRQAGLKIRMSDGQYQFHCLIDLAERQAELTVAGQEKILRTGPLPELPFDQPVKIELSLFDRQVLLAVNNQLIFEPYAYRTPANPAALPRSPIAVAAFGAPLKLLRQKVYRDIYYRPIPSDPGAQPAWREYRLGPEEYFVLGDNSAVSIDSRHWEAGSVTESLLIGRPVVLHLPSYKKTLEVGNYQTRIRMPDWNRMKLLR